MNEDFSEWFKKNIDGILEAYMDVQKLYNLTESDVILMTQMLTAIRELGFSAQLTTRLLKPLSALMEMLNDRINKEKK